MHPSPERCPWCGGPLTLVWVHGHGQCVRCGTNLDECCRGETAEATTPLRKGAPCPWAGLTPGERR
ncbi:MAG TPA: hypothetical protein VIK91_01745 [Nannocystis sp.]